MTSSKQLTPKVARLAQTIEAKIAANDESLKKADSGRITWRWKGENTLEVTIQPDL